MALRINGIDGSYPLPTLLNKKYVYRRFDATMTIGMEDGSKKVVDVKPKLTAIWREVEQKAKLKPCNEYFKTLGRVTPVTLDEILKGSDIKLHWLELKPNASATDLPNANTAGRDIGLHPFFLVDPEQSWWVCTLVHELARNAGATSNISAPFAEAHAAEAALPKCGCAQHYDKTIIGKIQSISSGRVGYA